MNNFVLEPVTDCDNDSSYKNFHYYE